MPTATFEYIEASYNRQRLHSSLIFHSPPDHEAQKGPPHEADRASGCPANRVSPVTRAGRSGLGCL
jgi:hypothetical protein